MAPAAGRPTAWAAHYLGVKHKEMKMIQSAIAGLILIGIYRFLDRNRTPEDFDPKVDWWMAFVFVMAPSMLIFLLAMGLGVISMPSELALFGYLFYFLIPFGMMKGMLEFQTKRAVVFSLWVPAIAVVTEISAVLLIGVPNA